MKISFIEGYYAPMAGYAPVNPQGDQIDYVHRCKEVFANSLRSVPAKGRGKAAVVHFIRTDNRTKDANLVKQQERVLHAFERVMDIQPPATVEQIKSLRQPPSWRPNDAPTTEYYFLYTVSARWRKNLPLAHILALITRNYYPEGKRMDWRSILIWLTKKRVVGDKTRLTIADIIRAGGKVRPDVPNNGISSYARNLNRRMTK